VHLGTQIRHGSPEHGDEGLHALLVRGHFGRRCVINEGLGEQLIGHGSSPLF
jgi:hypothetical protein